MIRVEVSRNLAQIEKIQIRGHADSGPYGQDLVCAAVSATVIGAANAIDLQFPKSCRLQMDKKISIEVLQSSDLLQACLSMLVLQLQSIAEDNEKFIQIREQNS